MLQKQTVSIPFDMGIDLKNAPPLIDNRHLAAAQNCRFIKGAGGQLQKRNGYSLLPTVDAAGNTIAGGQALAALNNELDLIANDTLSQAPSALYGLAPSQSAWVRKGPITQVQFAETPVVKTGYSQSVPDSATVGGVTCYAWVDSRGGVWAKVLDQNNGSILTSDTQLTSIGTNPRVTIDTTGTSFVIWCTDTGGNLNYAQVTAAGAISWQGSVMSGIADSAPFDASAYSTHYYVSYKDGSNHISIIAFDSGFNAGSPTTLDTTTPVCIQHLVISSSVLDVAFSTTSDHLKLAVVAIPGLTFTLFDENLGVAVPLLVIGPSTTSAHVNIYCQIEPRAGNDRIIAKTYWSQSTGYVSDTASWMRGVGLVSQQFQENGINYLLVAYASGSPQSTEQNTFFLVTEAASIVGRFFSGTAGTFPSSPRPASVLTLGSGIAGIPVQNEIEFISAGGTPVILDGLSQLSLTFSNKTLKSTQLGQDLTLSGALPQVYDGANLYEDGFNIFPEAPTLTIATSQIGLSYIDGNATTAAVTTIIIPTNQIQAGFDGELITPGEYLAPFIPDGGVNDQAAIYFTVNGSGNSPTGDYETYACSISSSDTAGAIAFKLAAVINANLSSYFTATVVENGNTFSVVVTRTATGFETRITTNRQFEGNMLSFGSPSTYAEYVFSMIPASLILPGSYLSFQTLISGNPVPVYCWYKVSGSGTDPLPFSGTNGTDFFSIEVDIQSSWPAYVALGNNSVAKATANAINASSAGISGAAGNYATVTVSPSTHGSLGLNSFSWTIGNGLGEISGVAVGGQLSSYSVVAIYEAIDAQGQLHRSSPSEPTQIQFWDYGNHNTAISAQTTMLRLTARPAVDVAFYATIANGSVYYRFSSPTALIANNPAIDYVSCVDNVPDATLQGNELLYTTGGVVANDPPPAGTGITNFQDRIWMWGLEDPQLVWWSKEFSNGVSVEFSAEQTTRFDPSGGPVVAALGMDGNFVVFEQTKIWVLNGDGLDPTGGGTPFSGPTIVSAAVGCRDPNSVVLLPIGILFKSYKGWYLLDRSLGLSYIGQMVEAYNADVMTAATIKPNTTEIILLSSSGTTLLADYQLIQGHPDEAGDPPELLFSTFTNHAGNDAILFQGTYYYLRTNANVYEDNPGNYHDNATSYLMSATTGFFKLNGVQGFQRLWKFLLEGFFPASSNCEVQISYLNQQGDGIASSVNETHLLPTASDLSQVKVYNQIQLCQGVQITIAETGAPSSGQAMALNAIDLELGIRKGAMKLGIGAATG